MCWYECADKFDSGSIKIAVNHGVLSKRALVLTVSKINENCWTSGLPLTADICWYGPFFPRVYLTDIFTYSLFHSEIIFMENILPFCRFSQSEKVQNSSSRHQVYCWNQANEIWLQDLSFLTSKVTNRKGVCSEWHDYTRPPVVKVVQPII